MSEEQDLQKKFEKIKKDATRQFRKYTKTYLKDAHDTDCAPTEDQAVQEVFQNGNYIFENNETYAFLTVAQQKQIKEACKKDIETDIRAQYRRYIDKYHSQVNGQSPYHVTEDSKKELQKYIKDIQSHMMTELNDFLGDCAKNGVCPNQKQMTACYEGWMNKYWKKDGPSFKLTGPQHDWILHELEGFFPTMDKTYHAYADSVKVTNTYPGDYVGVTVSAPPNPRDPKPNTPDGAGSTGKNGSPKPPVQSSTPQQPKEPKDYGPLASVYTKTNVSFSGCDMVVSANMKSSDGHVVSVVMGSVQTVSYSIYRKLSPILNIGNVNAKDYVGGPRTIAGSLVFTVFNQHWASQLMDEFMEAEGYAATRKVLMDEVAPIDLTIAMANEYGINSRLAIYGIRLFSEGQVMSINDIYTENTYQYVALNIDYLANVNQTDDVWGEYEKRTRTNSSTEVQTNPVNKGDTSRVESHAPNNPPSKESGSTSGPSTNVPGESQRIPGDTGGADRSPNDAMHKDAKSPAPKEDVDANVGHEPAAGKKNEQQVRHFSDTTSFNGKTISLKGKTRVQCKSELQELFGKAQEDLGKARAEGKIVYREFLNRQRALQVQRNAAVYEIDGYFDQEAEND